MKIPSLHLCAAILGTCLIIAAFLPAQNTPPVFSSIYNGTTSGSATVGVAAVAGNPAKLNLPISTGNKGQMLSTDGGNPQQLAWIAPGLMPNSSTTGANIISLPTSGWTIRNGALLNDFAITETDIRAANSGSLNLRGVSRSLSVPYTLYAMLECIVDRPFQSSQACGIGITDGTKYETIEQLYQNTTDLQLRIQVWTDINTPSTTVAGPTVNLVGLTAAYKIVNNSTNRIWSYWSNGAWVQFLSEGTTANLTETGAGVFGISAVAASDGSGVDAKLLYFSVQ